MRVSSSQVELVLCVNRVEAGALSRFVFSRVELCHVKAGWASPVESHHVEFRQGRQVMSRPVRSSPIKAVTPCTP